MDSQKELQFLLNQLGDFGKYQVYQHILHCVVTLMSAIHMTSFIFVFPRMEHRCYIEGIDGNWSYLSEVENLIPKTEEGKLQSCFKYHSSNGSSKGLNTTDIVPCGEDGFVYSSSSFRASRVIEWDMVCEDEWMRAILQSSFLFGSMLGAFFGGIVADKVGRKEVLCFSGVYTVFCGLGVVLCYDYGMCVFFMILYGFFGAGCTTVTAVTLSMELVGPTYKRVCVAMLNFSFGIGCILVATWAYFLPENARKLQLLFALHSVLLFGNHWLVDESIIWLWANGEKGEALGILKKAAELNGVILAYPEKTTVVPNEPLNPTSTNITEEKLSLLDIFQVPELRKQTLVMLSTWFAAGALYFGLMMKSNSVHFFGNLKPYFDFMLNCILELPAYAIFIFLVPKTGYKLMICASLTLAGISCVALAVLTDEIMITPTIFIVAKICTTLLLNAVLVHTAELFPTLIQNTGMGICVTGNRLGAALIPLINWLGRDFKDLSMLVFGVLGITASVGACFLLPEIMNKPIPQIKLDVKKENMSIE